MSNTDQGVYLANSARYAAAISSHCHLLLTWAATGSGFPVVGNAAQQDPRTDMIMTVGLREEGGFFKPVPATPDTKCNVYHRYPCQTAEQAWMGEFVAFNTAQTLQLVQFFVELEPEAVYLSTVLPKCAGQLVAHFKNLLQHEAVDEYTRRRWSLLRQIEELVMMQLLGNDIEDRGVFARLAAQAEDEKLCELCSEIIIDAQTGMVAMDGAVNNVVEQIVGSTPEQTTDQPSAVLPLPSSVSDTKSQRIYAFLLESELDEFEEGMFLRALAANPKNSHAYSNFGLFLRRVLGKDEAVLHDGRTMSVRELYLEAVACDNLNSSAYNHLGFELQADERITLWDGRSMGKRELFLEAIAHDCKCAYAYNNLAFLLQAAEQITLRDERVMGKRTLFIEAIACNFKCAKAYHNLSLELAPGEQITLKDG